MATKEEKLKAIKDLAKGMGMPIDKLVKHKASGGNVAKYYNAGGRVAGCGPAQNKTS